jgi:hypothetical protein
MELSVAQDGVAMRSVGRVDAAAEWRAKLAIVTMAGLAFETLTGLLIYLFPFSVFNQYGVLLHTLIGIVWLPVFSWYTARHWWLRYRGKFSHIQLLGYVSFALIAVCIASGVVLTADAAFGTRIDYTWELAHLVTGLGLIFVVFAHLLVVWVRKVNAPEVAGPLRRAKRTFLAGLVGGTCALVALHAASAAFHVEPPTNNEFPDDYSWKFGKDRPFAPSLVRTESDWAYDPTTLSDSAGCGTSGCHSDIVREWEPSAHRYASSDIAFQAVQRLMLEDTGAESTRYCAGCHDPIALLSGHKNVNVEGLTSVGAEDGVSCIVCHSIVQTDVRGNADYTVTQPVRYVGERKGGALNKFVSDFLIRVYPKQHKESFARPLYKTAEYCAACHKQFIDEEVNQIGWVQLQNQYDNWRKSRWYHEGDATKTITCRECHMPLVSSTDPASGDSGDYNRNAEDGKHRSHRFLGANQFIPLLMKLPRAEEHVALVEKWLRGEIAVPEIEDKWEAGPVIRLELAGPERVKPGQQVDVQVILTNNKVGHGFPTGPLDIIRSWVEVTVTDEEGNIVFQNGQLGEHGEMAEGALVFKAEGIDRYGNDIDRHNLWEMVGARFKRALFPGTSDMGTYTFACPGFTGEPFEEVESESQPVAFDAPGKTSKLTVSAVLNYQKADALFLDRLFGTKANIRTPVTQISSDTLSILVDQ